MIPAGTHPAVAISHQWGRTKKDKEQIAVAFRIIDGPAAGQSITWFGYFTEKTWERTLQALRFAGWKGDDLSDLGELDQEVEIVVEHEEYEGKIRAKVAWVNRSGGVQLANPMAPQDLRVFAAQMKARAKDVPPVDGQKAAPRSSSPPPPNDNDYQPPRSDNAFEPGWQPPVDDDLPF